MRSRTAHIDAPSTPTKSRFAKRLAHLLAVVIAASVVILGTPATATAATGFHIKDGRLYDANGVEFVMRGINHPATWFPGEADSFREISNLGANTVRVVLASGSAFTRTPVSQVQDAVNRCKANRLVCVLEVHDTTGYRDSSGAPAGAASLASAVDYWKSIASVVKGQERYVIINIGNEPFGNVGSTKVFEWTTATSSAIRSLRSAGFTHTLMVDAPNWGQDWTNTMREDGGVVLAADSQKNTMLSVHMYGVYQDGTAIANYIDHFITWNKWPIVVGEFGSEQGGQNVNESAIMTAAQNRRVGYIGWSYSGNGGSDAVLDIVRNFDPTQLTAWGSQLLNHPAGIRNTSQRATVY